VHPDSVLPCDIPFGAIISIINRGRLIFLNNRLRPLGLSAGQFPVLVLLYREQNITQETLVRHYHLDKGTIARAVKKLETAGYIRRIIDPLNRRAVRLFLTEKGESAAPVLQDIIHEWEARTCDGLSGNEAKTLHTLIRTAAQNNYTIMKDSGGFPDAEK
jgi:MarR family transcriptional regulator, temperature-dependent positive regulator of motility